MQIQKLKLGQNNDEGSINLAGANKKATLKCKKIIMKTLAKLYQSVYCHSITYTKCNGTCSEFVVTSLVATVIVTTSPISGGDRAGDKPGT